MKYILLVLLALCACDKPKPLTQRQQDMEWFESLCSHQGKGVKCIYITWGPKNEMNCTCSNEQ